METDIRFLDLLEQDLRRAAAFEAAQSPAPVPRGRKRTAWLGLAAGLVAFLLIAGVVGLLDQNGVLNRDQAGKSVREGSSPAGEATGEVPQSAPREQFDSFGGGGNTGGTGATGSGISGAPALDDQSGAGDLTKIIRKGDLSLTVPRDGLGKAVDTVTAIANEKGGFVFSSSVGEHEGNLVLRLPAARFDAAVTALRRVGAVTNVTITSQDVTAEFIDLNARLGIAIGRRRVLQQLYAKATTIEQTVRVLDALDETQLRIEETQGQLNVIENQTSQSTIRVGLREEGTPDASAETVENPSIGSAWDRAIAGFFGVIAAVVIGIGYLVPIAILALLVMLVVTLVRRRRAANPEP